MKTSIVLKDGKLIVNGSPISELENVVKFVPINETACIVLIKPEPELRRNIYRVSFTGEIIWRIEAPKTGLEINPYVALSEDQDNRIIAETYSASKYEIDPLTGKILANVTGGRPW